MPKILKVKANPKHEKAAGLHAEGMAKIHKSKLKGREKLAARLAVREKVGVILTA